jgi:O-antigen/teichoic acid export membrane protein
VTALLVFKVMMSGLVGLPEAALEGMNLRYRRMLIRVGITLLGGVLSLGAMYLGYGLIGLAAVQIILAAATAALAWKVARQHLPWFHLSWPTWSGTKSFVGISTAYLGSSSLQKLIFMSDILILGIVASAAAVTNYTLTAYASTILLYTVPAILNSAVPGFGKLLKDRKHDRILELRSEMLTIGWLLLASAGTVILIWNRSFVHLWVGPEHYAGIIPNLLILLVAAQLVFIQTDSSVIDMTLKLKQKSVLAAISVILTLALSVILIPLYGIAGLCVGLLVGRLPLSIGYPRIIVANLQTASSTFGAESFRQATVLLLMFAGGSWISAIFVTESWLIWLAGLCISAAVAVPFAAFLGLNRDRRGLLLKRLRSLKKKRAASGGG